ncbi:hemopexin [Clarias gariepinus]|uniref:hemopexin n=1 Tax=Clarias gariepinus TaxID=13013 RepID=UPI00234DBAFD|nr:hemopexin [Clarias gariepinus]
MRLLIQTFTICLALSLCLAVPTHHHEPGNDEQVAHGPGHNNNDHGHNNNDHGHNNNDHGHKDSHHFDRCKELVFDAAIESNEGIYYFFKDDHVFKGFHGEGELTNKTFPELDDHLVGHVDAAFRMPSEDSPDHHEHVFFFLDNKVFSYENHKLNDGYPKDIAEVFPGIPDHLDAAVECHKPDCPKNTVIFFKGHEIYHFDIDSKEVHHKEFQSMPNCSAAFHYTGHYYCLHGHHFSKFNPNTGEVHGRYPKEARDYFMSCPHYGDKTEKEHIEREQCSHVHLDAITEDDDHDLFAFRGHYYLSRIDGKTHAGTIESGFKDLHANIDAAFAHDEHIHIIKDDKMYVYNISHTPGEPHHLREGYPKTVKDELGLEGHIDATFICPKDHIVHVIQGNNIYDVDLNAHPPTHTEAKPIPFKHVDTAMCGDNGVIVVVDDDYYHYASPMIFLAARIQPPKQDVATGLLGCPYYDGKTEAEHIKREQCSHMHLDAITEDDDHDLFAFRGHYYLSKIEDNYHAGLIESGFKDLHDDIDAAFAHDEHIHIINNDKVYVYNISHTPGEPHHLREGYPKTVKDELGLEGHIDATFICPKDHIVHVIQGNNIYDVDLNAHPPTHTEAKPIPFKHVHTATCGDHGVKVVVDDDYYEYESPMAFVAAKIAPEKKSVPKDLLGCTPEA